MKKQRILSSVLNIRVVMMLTTISVLWVHANQERWRNRNVIIQDVAHYYSYLPAAFYEKDLSFSFLMNGNLDADLAAIYAPNTTPDGKKVIKMTMGMALTYLPFFGLAHIFCVIFNLPANGVSAPYQMAVLLSTLFYYLVGLYFLNKVLSRFFSALLAATALFLITFGTNVFYYLTVGAGMAHIVGFAFFSILMWLTLTWYNAPNLKTAALIGAVGGFLTLVRPTNVLTLIFFLLYGVNSFEDLKNRSRLFAKHGGQVFFAMVSALLILLPQFVYWKYSTGHFVFNSYIDEHFYFGNSHVLKALFGFRKGWLIYSPIMIFTLIGFLFFKKREYRPFFMMSFILMAIYIYITFSWWCWWYGGSFGQRAMIDIYPLLCVGLAAFLAGIRKFSALLRKPVYALLVSLVCLNLFQTIQAKYNIIHYDSMTWENYTEVFFSISKKPDREKFLVHPNYERAKMGFEED